MEVSSKLRELEALQEALRKLQEDQELYQSYQAQRAEREREKEVVPCCAHSCEEVLKGDGLVVPASWPGAAKAFSPRADSSRGSQGCLAATAKALGSLEDF